MNLEEIWEMGEEKRQSPGFVIMTVDPVNLAPFLPAFISTRD